MYTTNEITSTQNKIKNKKTKQNKTKQNETKKYIEMKS